MIKLIEHESGTQNFHSASYICSTADFVAETDMPDGTELQVVNESTHKVEKYCVAYNGYWNER